MSRSTTRMNVNGVRGHALSDDSTKLIVTFTTRHVGDFDLLMTPECVDALITELDRAKTTAPAELGLGAAPVRVPATTEATPAEPGKGSPPVNVRVPKKWLVTADHKVRGGIVLLVFDHRTETQVGFALNPGPAKEMAAGLTKQADAVLAHRANKAN